MKIKTTLLLVVTSLTYGLAAASEPQITMVTFQRCTSKVQCSDIARWSETPHASAPNDIRVVATIVNPASYSDEVFLLTTTDYMIAPLSAYSVADFEKLKTGNEVSWGQLTKDDDMRAFVLHGVRRETKHPTTLRVLDVRKLLKNSFSEPDALWPWLVRVTAILVNRQGHTLSTQSGILELVPSDQRTKASTDPPARPSSNDR